LNFLLLEEEAVGVKDRTATTEPLAVVELVGIARLQHIL
jgi:hypothetical protein